MSIDTTKTVTSFKVDGTAMTLDISPSQNVTLNLTGMTAQLAKVGSEKVQLTLVPLTEDWELPDSISFSSGITDGTYDKTTGVVTFTAPSTTGQSITAKGMGTLGVEWVNDASITMTRTDAAVGMTYSVNSSTGKFTSDFDSVFPYNQMKRTTIGSDVFVTVPSMWFRIGYDADNKIVSVAVKNKQGAAKTKAGVTYVWHQTKAFYYGAYGASSDGTILKSVTGATRLANITRAVARTRAMATGTGYHQRDLYSGTILMFLFWIEYATKASQNYPTTLGGVYPAMSLGAAVQTGGTDSIYSETAGANFCVSGYNPTTNQMVWHGIEDFFNNVYEWEDGITGNATSGGTQYVSDDYTKYDDYSGGTTQMSALSFNSPTTSGNCLEALGWDDTKPFLVQPIATRNDGNYTSGFTDYVVTDNNIVSGRGSNWVSDADNGVSCFFRRNASNARSTIGCRLLLES